MKKGLVFLISILLLVILVFTTALTQGNQPEIPPRPIKGNYIFDSLGWLNSNQKTEINNIITKPDVASIAEIMNKTHNYTSDDKQTLQNKLFNEWGIGHADRDDGLLIMVCWHDEDKTRRSIEQKFRYGTEDKIMNRSILNNIAKQYFEPVFSSIDDEVVRTGEAGDALVAMVKAYDSIFRRLQLGSTAILVSVIVATMFIFFLMYFL